MRSIPKRLVAAPQEIFSKIPAADIWGEYITTALPKIRTMNTHGGYFLTADTIPKFVAHQISSIYYIPLAKVELKRGSAPPIPRSKPDIWVV